MIHLSVLPFTQHWGRGLGKGGLFLALTLSLSAQPLVQDNSIYEDRPDNTNGGYERLFAGRTVSSLRRALIRFELPTGITSADVVSAEVTLVLEFSGLNAEDDDVYTLHRLTNSWGEGDVVSTTDHGLGAPADEGDATWRSNHHLQSEWDTFGGGGDFVTAASASLEIARWDQFVPENNIYPFSAPGLADDVRTWLDDPDANFGWIMLGQEDASRTSRRFVSSEGEEGMGPRLTIFVQLIGRCGLVLN